MSDLFSKLILFYRFYTSVIANRLANNFNKLQIKKIVQKYKKNICMEIAALKLKQRISFFIYLFINIVLRPEVITVHSLYYIMINVYKLQIIF